MIWFILGAVCGALICGLIEHWRQVWECPGRVPLWTRIFLRAWVDDVKESVFEFILPLAKEVGKDAIKGVAAIIVLVFFAFLIPVLFIFGFVMLAIQVIQFPNEAKAQFGDKE